jgi:hypothetical protein
MVQELDKIRQEFSQRILNAPFTKVRPNEELTAVRQVTHADETAKLTAEATGKSAKAAEEATAARAAADQTATHFAAVRDALQAEAAKAGRVGTFSEGQRVGRIEERAARAESEAQKLHGILSRGEAAAPGVREAAYKAAVDDAMKNLPKAKRTAEETAARAEKANEALRHHQDFLHDRIAAGLDITPNQMRRLGKLEGEVNVLDRIGKAVAKGQEGAFAKANRKLAGAAGKANEAADLSPLQAAAQRARLLADKAHATAYEAGRRAEETAALAKGEVTYGTGKQLGKLEEQARAAARVARKKEEQAARLTARTEKAVAESIPKKAAKAADKAVKAATRKNVYLKDINDYVLHSLTPEGKKILEASPGPAASAFKREPSEIASAFSQGGSLKHRGPLGNMSIPDANARMAEIYKAQLKDGEKFFEDNPIKLTVMRAATAEHAVSEARLVSDLTTLKDVGGNALVMVGKESAKEARNLGYTKVGGKYVDDIWAEPTIAHELERFNKVVNSDAATAGFRKAVDEWGSLWAGYATTPLIFGTGFFARNAMGNMFNNVLAGIKHTEYARALKGQVGIAKAIEETGRTIGPEFEAALIRHVGANEAKVIQLARDHGALSEGFFNTDLAKEVADRVVGSKGLRSKLNPLNKQNILLAPGQKFNNAIEQNARLAHFMGKFDETGDAILASRSVKKYLFDYGDLTAFEKGTMRRVVRFYTYMRKNTPLQFAEIAHQPGKFTALTHATEAASDQGGGQGLLPNYALGQGTGVVPFGKTLLSVDTPFSSAAKNIEPSVQALAMVPGFKQLLPQSVRPEGGIGEVARNALNVPSGGPIEVIKYAAEEAFGKTLFTGARVKKNTLGAGGHAERFAAAVLPLFAKGRTTVNKVADLDGKDQARARLLTTLLGLYVTPTGDEKTQKGEAMRQLQLVSDALQKLKDEGVTVPTVDELRQAGIIPKAPKTHKAPTKKLSPAAKKKAALDAVKAAGIKLPAPKAAP